MAALLVTVRFLPFLATSGDPKIRPPTRVFLNSIQINPKQTKSIQEQTNATSEFSLVLLVFFFLALLGSSP